MRVYRLFPMCLAASLLVIAACNSGPKTINFEMNEETFPDVTRLADIKDTSVFYAILTGDTVVFKDISAPATAVDKRYWDLDGNANTGWEALDEDLTRFRYDRAGTFKVVLCINDTLHCQAKAILVRERLTTEVVKPTPTPEPEQPIVKTPKPPPPPKKPEVRFLRPNVYSTNHNEESFSISVQLRGVSGKEDIRLLVNGKEHKQFTYSRGLLSSKVPLQVGKNYVKVSVSNEVGTAEKEIEFERSIPPPTAAPPPAPVPSIVFAKPADRTETSASETYEIVLVTSNVSKKNQLRLTVGGKEVKKFDFSPGTGELVAKVELSPGENKVKASVDSPNGVVSQEATVIYKKPEVVPPPPPNLSTYGLAGIPLNQYSSDCITALRGSFSVTLTPVQDVEARSFKVYTDDCGGVKVALTGPQLNENFRATLNKGRTLIDFADSDARLKAGNTYTLTCTPISGYGGCSSSKAPAFHDLRNCSDVSSASAPALKLNDKGNLVLFDLKFVH